jgi:hypothetical protein
VIVNLDSDFLDGHDQFADAISQSNVHLCIAKVAFQEVEHHPTIEDHGTEFSRSSRALGFCRTRPNATRAIISASSEIIIAEYLVARSIERRSPMRESRTAQESGRLLAGAYSPFRN